MQQANRPLSDEERQQAAAIRAGGQEDFPPKTAQQNPSPPGIPGCIHTARKQRGMTRYELGLIASTELQGRASAPTLTHFAVRTVPQRIALQAEPEWVGQA